MTKAWWDGENGARLRAVDKTPAPDVILTPDVILADPCASSWLKTALKGALSRDLVDAVNDAEVLVKVLAGHLAAVTAEVL